MIPLSLACFWKESPLNLALLNPNCWSPIWSLNPARARPLGTSGLSSTLCSIMARHKSNWSCSVTLPPFCDFFSFSCCRIQPFLTGISLHRFLMLEVAEGVHDDVRLRHLPNAWACCRSASVLSAEPTDWNTIIAQHSDLLFGRDIFCKLSSRSYLLHPVQWRLTSHPAL